MAIEFFMYYGVDAFTLVLTPSIVPLLILTQIIYFFCYSIVRKMIVASIACPQNRGPQLKVIQQYSRDHQIFEIESLM